MRSHTIRRLAPIMQVLGVSFALLASAATPVLAATIGIQFTGMDLLYDGSTIYDSGSTSGGLANPADADPLTSVDFFVDGSSVGSLSSDVSLDVFIPDVTGISAAANTVDVQTTPGNPGFFDLLIGTSPLASEYLLLDLEAVTITYLDVQNVVQFTFGAAITDTFAANLPFGLDMEDPVTVSFSAQIVPGTLTDNGTDVTGFEATGTGEIRGPGTVIPEPSTGVLAAFGVLGTLVARGRGRRR